MAMIIGLRFSVLVICSLMIAARPAPPLLHGVYQSDCAPNDGPAFIIILPTPEPQAEFWLKANVPVTQMAGHWSQTSEMATQPGMPSMLLCRTAPGLTCDRPDTGFFTVTGRPGGAISGTFEASFRSGVRYAYRFSAVPARLAQPVLCG
jgi:hypothetical protein